MTEPRFRLEIWSDRDQHGNREWVASTYDTWKHRAPWADTFDDYADALRFGMVMLGELYTEPVPLDAMTDGQHCSGCSMPGGRHWDTCPNRRDGRPTR